jgi:transketolase
MAWAYSVQLPDGPKPNVLLLTRQKVPTLEPVRPSTFQKRDIWKGGYVAAEADGGKPDLVIIATGSEVGPAVEAKRTLEAAGTKTRVVSMPCVEQFKKQDQAYRDSVLPAGVPRVSVEAGRTDPWYQFVGLDGLAIGLDHFGHSAPGEVLADKLGFTGARIAATVNAWLKG